MYLKRCKSCHRPRLLDKWSPVKKNPCNDSVSKTLLKRDQPALLTRKPIRWKNTEQGRLC